ncbi:MAG: hypothetical protein ABJB47_07205 [Actinomycetota bacterium]
MHELRGALREAPVEASIIRAAQEAYAWLDADAELELLTLQAQPATVAAAVRSGAPGAPRLLTFSGERLSVEIEIDDNGIVGQLIPPQAAQITLVTAAGPQASAEADEVGCFTLPMPAPGPLRLDCQLNGDRFVTEWATA